MAAQAGLCLKWSQTPEDRFSHDVAQIFYFQTDRSFDLVFNKMFPCISSVDISKEADLKFISFSRLVL